MNNFKINNNNNKNIEVVQKIKENIHICLACHFHSYILNLSKFIKNVYKSFINKFGSNCIFINEKYELNQKKDINLFTDFIFFLIRFDFEYDKKFQYRAIWEDTFLGTCVKDTDLVNIKWVSMNLKGDDLLVKFHFDGEQAMTIKNINNYSINTLFAILFDINGDIDIFDLNRCLKIDKYDTELFIKQKWNQISEYVCDIFCSPVIKSAFSKAFNFETDVLNNRGYLMKILNEIRFFSFDSNFTAETKKRILLVCVQDYISNNRTKDINIKKLIYLAIFLIACIHEIVGHLSLRIHNYLHKENQAKFPTEYRGFRGKESGEFLEGKLFGDYKCQMTIKQILYILDIKNYQYENSDDFMNKFMKLENEKIVPSQRFNEILNIYEITIDYIKINCKTLYSINKNRYNDKIILPPHHSISQIDSDDD